MTAAPVTGAPKPKAPPPLNLRADRPAAIRLRKSVVRIVVMGAAALLAGSLAWAFILEPELRGHGAAAHDRLDPSKGSVRPAEAVTNQPASYDKLKDELPPPRVPFQRQGAEAAGAPKPGRGPAKSASSQGPSPAQLAARSGLFFEARGAQAASDGKGAGAAPKLNADYGAMYDGHPLLAPLSPYELKAGAIVPAVLLSAMDTARAGPVVAAVTQNTFDSVSGRNLLVPQGSRLIGRHDGESAYGDKRAFITWLRLILPNGKSVVLAEEPGVDAQGAVGVRGQIDRRLGELTVATLFAGAITTLGTIARDDDRRGSGGILGDVGDAAAIQGAQVGGRLLDRELQVHPTIRLKAGAPVRVLITKDLILEPFQP